MLVAHLSNVLGIGFLGIMSIFNLLLPHINFVLIKKIEPLILPSVCFWCGLFAIKA
jgi:hypothetical protein